MGPPLEDETFVYYTPCGRAHPGLCADRDDDILPRCHALSKSLHAVLARYPPGTFSLLRVFQKLKEEPIHLWICSGYHRGSGPHVDMLFSVEKGGGLTMHVQLQDDIYHCMHVMTFSGILFRNNLDVDLILLSAAALCGAFVPTSAGEVRLAADWMNQQSTWEIELYPTPVRAKRASAVDRGMKRGLQALGGKTQEKAPSSEAPVKLVYPASKAKALRALKC